MVVTPFERMSPALRRIMMAALVFLFVGLVLNAYLQFWQAWTDLNRNLETTLTVEGQTLAAWLSETLAPIGDLDPFYENRQRRPPLTELTGASWVLLDASGEVATNGYGEPLFKTLSDASAEIDWSNELALIEMAARDSTGQTVASDLTRRGKIYSKRVYLPVRDPSGLISQPWVLAGQAGEGYLSDLFAEQQRFLWTASVLTLASAVFLVLLFRGIVRTEKLEAALREAEESMELESLTSTLAHELRNPLSIIQSSAEILLRDENLSEDGRELTHDLISEVGRSQDVLSSHLHPERNTLTVVKDLKTLARGYWQRRGAYLETHRTVLETVYPQSEDPLPVRAIGERLLQIWDNLLRNSIEASPEGGTVSFELEETEDLAIVRFRDSGPGLHRSRFFWKDGWKLGSTKPEGKGIGLRLARKWIEKWGGELDARDIRESFFSSPTGTEIQITLKRLDKKE